MVNLIRIVILLIALLPTAYAAEFTATVDRSELTTDEHLVLTLSLFNSDTRLRAQGVNPNIDLTVLADDFDIGTPRNKTNYNVFRNRGRATSSLEVELFPKTTGTFTIPTFSVDNTSTQTINIKVLDSKYSNAPLAFSKAGVNHTSVWQHQQLVAYIDTYYRTELESAKLGGNIELEPRPLEVHEHYRLPASERTEQHHGFTYQVKRASWAIFPLDSGILSIYLPDTWIVTTNQEKLRLPHQTIKVDVKALPTQLAANTLIGKPSISLESVQKSDTVGNINSWRIKIESSSSFKSLPATLQFDTPDDLTLFVDNKNDDREDKSDGVKQIGYYNLTAIAKNQGQYQLPDISLDYFDPSNGKTKTASLTGPQLNITQSSRQDPVSGHTSIPATDDESNHWFLTTILFAGLWLATLGYFLHKARTSTNQDNLTTTSLNNSINPTETKRPLETQLLSALKCQSLEQGLLHLRQQNASQHLLETLRQVQQLYYSPNSTIDIKQLETQVNQCCKEIVQLTKVQTSSVDPYQPEAFTKSL